MNRYRLCLIHLPSVLETTPQIELYGVDNHHHNGAKQPELKGVNGANRLQWE